MSRTPRPSRRKPTPHLPRRTVRLRLTLLYGGLFLISGAALLAVTYALVVHTSGDAIFDGVHVLIKNPKTGKTEVKTGKIGGDAKVEGVSVPPPLRARQNQAARIARQAAAQRNHERHQLLIESAVALALMTVVSVGLGWLVAGRVLRPLEESYESQRRFVANASHELRTPLTMMRTSLDVAVAKPAARVDTLEVKLREGLDRADRLLEGFLVLARAQHGDVAEEVPVSLTTLARDALRANDEAIAARGLAVEARLGEATVAGSEVLLARLVENLVENAVRHNELDGRLRIETAEAGGRARIVVESDGAPLDQEEVRELAQPFRRLGAERTGQDGVGLGLSIVAAIVGAHDGELALRARPEGGLRVEVDLPLCPAAVPA